MKIKWFYHSEGDLIMRIRKLLKYVLVVMTIVVVAAGCSRGDSKKNTNSSSQTSSGESKPLTNFDSIKNKIYITSGSYKGKAKKDFSSVSWKKVSDKYSFVFMSNKQAFVGKYVNGKLDYGRIYQISKGKNNFFNFNQESFVTSERNYSNMSQKIREKYSKVDNKKIPGASKGVVYYEAKNTKHAKNTVSYRFYKTKGSLIRENTQKKGIHNYIKNTVK